MDQEQLEKQIIYKMLDCNSHCFDILRNQYKNSSILSRNFTQFGFFTTFSVSNDLVFNRMQGEISDVIGTFDDISDLFGFRLTISNGRIDTLEGFAISGKWPSKFEKTILDYTLDDGRRYHIYNFGK